MSGGSHDYIYAQIDNYLVGKMHDIELDDMMRDISDLAHDLEWWQSGDISKEAYRNRVRKFKDKWFGYREERLIGFVNMEIEKLRTELVEMVGDVK